MSDSKKYLIVGASSGVGAALLNVLNDDHHHVITASRRNVIGSFAHIPFDVTKDEMDVTVLRWPDKKAGCGWMRKYQINNWTYARPPNNIVNLGAVVPSWLKKPLNSLPQSRKGTKVHKVCVSQVNN